MHELLKTMQKTLVSLEQGQNEIRADLRAVKMQNIETQRQLVVQEGDVAEMKSPQQKNMCATRTQKISLICHARYNSAQKPSPTTILE